MNELPQGWAWASLAELGRWCGGGTPSKSNAAFWTEGTVPWISPKDMKAHVIADGEDHVTEAAVTRSSTNVVPPGSVLAVTRSGILRRTFPIAVTASSVAINQDLKALIPANGVSAAYVAWALRSDERSILSECAKDGTTVDSIDFPRLLSRTIAIAPTAEQGRIVAAIEEQFSRLDAGVAALHSARRKLKRMRAAVLQAAVTGQLVQQVTSEDVDETLTVIEADRRAIWADQMMKPYRPPARAAKFDLDLPGHWRLASLEALTDPVRVICYGILMPKENIADGVPYVRVKDMRGWSIDVGGLKRTSRAIADSYARASLTKGDLLLAIRGSYGRVARVPEELEGGNITQDTARIAAHPLVDRRYLLYYLGGSVGNRYYERVARGVAVKGVNIGDLRTMPVPVPPRTEQVAIADEVERQFTVLDAMESANEEQLRRAASLRSSILSGAFTGRLVRQDADDEAASVLLERIAAKRISYNGRGRTAAGNRRTSRQKGRV